MSQENAKSKKVIIWGHPDVLSWAVEHFLSARKDWDVASLSNKRGIDGLIYKIEKSQPNIVILYQRNCAKSGYLPAQLLLNYPGLTVITVNPDNNEMEVYVKKQVNIESVSDLISVVEGEFSPVQ